MVYSIETSSLRIYWSNCRNLIHLEYLTFRGIYSKPPYTEYISTRWYRSPECLLTVGYYGPKMDVWAAGCVFYEMLTLKPLFPGSNEIDQLAKIHSVLGTPSNRLINKLKKKSHNCQNFPRQIGSGLAPLVGSFSDDCQSVMKLMIQYDPESRINVRRLVEHRYFTSLREQYLINQFRFTALEQNAGIGSFAKCKGDHIVNYLSYVDKVRQNKFQNISPRVYNVHKNKKLSPMQNSKTSTDLNKPPYWQPSSPRRTNIQKTKKPPMQSSKTFTNMVNHETSSNPKKHLLREGGGPLVSQKQFKEWGVNPSILKPKETSPKFKSPNKEQNQRPRPQHKRNQQSNYISDGFRKTTSNLTKSFKKLDQTDGDVAHTNTSSQFHSKSFVLPRRVTARLKLDTVKEYWMPNSKEKSPVVGR